MCCHEFPTEMCIAGNGFVQSSQDNETLLEEETARTLQLSKPHKGMGSRDERYRLT